MGGEGGAVTSPLSEAQTLYVLCAIIEETKHERFMIYKCCIVRVWEYKLSTASNTTIASISACISMIIRACECGTSRVCGGLHSHKDIIPVI